MVVKNKPGLINRLLVFLAAAFIAVLVFSCGKQGNASPQGLNVEYHILNLSPDVYPVNLFIDNKQVNTNPYIYGVDQGYFYLPSLDTPFQIRSNLSTGTTLLTRADLLKSGAKYTLFITGTKTDNSLRTIFTVDSSGTPNPGRGKIRFVNASPSTSSGLDVFANGSSLFTGIVYQKLSDYKELPVGNYELQVQPTGGSTVIKDLPLVTIQDGRLYTLYAYGYTSRADSAAFNAAMITNK